MLAVKRRPGRKPEIIGIENTLEALQEAVGGYIETLTVDDYTVLVMDEEGKLKGKPVCMTYKGECLVGDILVLGYIGDEFYDIGPDAMKQWAPELFPPRVDI